MNEPTADLAVKRRVDPTASRRISGALDVVESALELSNEVKDRSDSVFAVSIHRDDACVAFIKRPGIDHPQLGAELARTRLHQQRATIGRLKIVEAKRSVGGAAVSHDDVDRRL